MPAVRSSCPICENTSFCLSPPSLWLFIESLGPRKMLGTSFCTPKVKEELAMHYAFIKKRFLHLSIKVLTKSYCFSNDHKILR
jgi:hypothetical protein